MWISNQSLAEKFVMLFIVASTTTTALRPSMDAARRLTQTTASNDWSLHQNLEPTRTLMAKAFASGEPIVDWLVRDLDIPGNDQPQERLNSYEFCMTFPLRDGFSQGGLVLSKGGKDRSDTMECGILFREYDPAIDGKKSIRKAIKAAVTGLSTYFRMGNGRKVGPFQGFFSKATQSYFDKGAFYDAISSKFHSQYGPSDAHWYITAVGVDPASQGKGHGKTLMSRMGTLADEVGMDIYLECAGARNKYFYEKMGFQEVGMELLDDGKGDIAQEVFLMIRPKTSSSRVREAEHLLRTSA